MQVWERVHVAAAAAVVVLGVVHSRKVWGALAPGAVLYGIALAHRCLQASRTATASISASGNVISAVVPLEVRPVTSSSRRTWPLNACTVEYLSDVPVLTNIATAVSA